MIEEYIANLFISLGYKAEKVGGSHDGGIDVIIKKDGETGYIQCKKFITSEVPVGAVRDLVVGHFATAKGYFISTNKFTLEAIKFAEDKPIELVDHFKLIKYIKLANREEKCCPKCGGLLVKEMVNLESFMDVLIILNVILLRNEKFQGKSFRNC